jgi:hypothetical protein
MGFLEARSEASRAPATRRRHGAHERGVAFDSVCPRGLAVRPIRAAIGRHAARESLDIAAVRESVARCVCARSERREDEDLPRIIAAMAFQESVASSTPPIAVRSNAEASPMIASVAASRAPSLDASSVASLASAVVASIDASSVPSLAPRPLRWRA